MLNRQPETKMYYAFMQSAERGMVIDLYYVYKAKGKTERKYIVLDKLK